MCVLGYVCECMCAWGCACECVWAWGCECEVGSVNCSIHREHWAVIIKTFICDLSNNSGANQNRHGNWMNALSKKNVVLYENSSYI